MASPAPDLNWIADPDIITSAIQVLSWAVVVAGALLSAVFSALIAVIVYIWHKTDAKVDRIAVSLETLTLTVATEIATIKATCAGNHPH
jgi:hypothetical protein